MPHAILAVSGLGSWRTFSLFVRRNRIIAVSIALVAIVAIRLAGPIEGRWQRWQMEHESLSKSAPALAVPDIFDQSVELSDDRGKVVLLYLWATWCPSCQVETPALVELQHRYESRGFAIIACSRDEDPELVRKFYRYHHLNYPVVMAVPQVQRLFGTALGIRDEEVLTEVPIPTSILIGRDGRIHRIYVGRDLAALLPALNDLLGIKPAA